MDGWREQRFTGSRDRGREHDREERLAGPNQTLSPLNDRSAIYRAPHPHSIHPLLPPSLTSFTLTVNVSQYLSLSPSLSVYFSFTMSVSLSLSISLLVCLSPSLFRSHSFTLSVSLPHSFYFSFLSLYCPSFSLSLSN